MIKMDFREFAVKFGLSEKQVQVYECVFSLGSVSAAEIVQRTGINRTLVYDYLNVLVEKELVSLSTVNNKRIFSALEPKLLLRSLEERMRGDEDKRKNYLKELQKSLAELERQFNIKDRAVASILLGEKGVRTLFRDIVSTLGRGEEDLVFIANYEGRGIFGDAIRNYYAQCKKKGVYVRVIFDSRQRTLKIGRETAKLPHVKVRFLPAEYSTLTTFHVYEKKVSMLLFSEEVFGLLIENEKVANGMRKHFEALWKIAKS